MGQRLRWRHKWGWWVDLTLVGLVALAARCYRLSTVRTGLNRDAAANGLYALDLLRGMYSSLDNVRLPATDLAGQRLPNDRIRLGSLRVLGAGQ